MLSDKELKELCSAITNPDEKFYKGVLYGEFGVRKTTTALRCSRKRAILLHADRGWNVYKNHPDEFKDENIIPIAYQNLTQVKALVQATVSNQEPFNDVDLIVADTISQMQEIYLDWLLENFEFSGNYREKATPRSGRKDEQGRPLRAQEITGMPDYHLARNKIRPVVNILTKAPVNVIYTAHLREPGMMDKDQLLRRANVTDALYKVIARDATFIGMMSKDKRGEFTIDFRPTNRTSAKSQIPSMENKEIKASELPQHLYEWSKI